MTQHTKKNHYNLCFILNNNADNCNHFPFKFWHSMLIILCFVKDEHIGFFPLAMLSNKYIHSKTRVSLNKITDFYLKS